MKTEAKRVTIQKAYAADCDWCADCLRWHGRFLTGEYAHWCADWDYLPIDETCEEFQCCVEYPPEVRNRFFIGIRSEDVPFYRDGDIYL